MANASHKRLRNSQMLLQISDFCASGSKNPQNFKNFCAFGAETLRISKIFAPNLKCFFIFKKFFAPSAQNASFVEFVVPQLPSLQCNTRIFLLLLTAISLLSAHVVLSDCLNSLGCRSVSLAVTTG